MIRATLLFSCLAILLCIPAQTAFAQAPAQPGLIYAVDGTFSSNLYTVEPQTGVIRLIGSTGKQIWIIATDSKGRIFGARYSGAQELYRLDGDTGASTLIGTMNIGLTNGDLTFDENDVLYAVDYQGLHRVDTNTAQATFIGPHAEQGSMAADPMTGTLYGLSEQYLDPTDLSTINKATASLTLVGTIPTSSNGFKLLAFDYDGTLYGIIDENFVRIDKTNASTTILATGLFSITSLANVFASPPQIQSVLDVGNDQGRQVRVIWNRATPDVQGGGVTQYGLWRRVDSNLLAGSTLSVVERAVTGSAATNWDFLGTVPARGDATYSMVAPTLCDSTDVGICYSTFFVSAMTADPFLYYDSTPDSGYSVDNLAPGAPSNLQLVTNDLSWDDAPEDDFEFYSVYGSSTGDFQDAVLITYTASTVQNVAGAPYAWYHVTVTDFSGNEGTPSNLEAPVTGLEDGVSPTVVALRVPQPNPFRSSTRVAFDLPVEGQASVAVYDVSGRLLVSLRDGLMPAGQHAVSWDGTDASGRAVAPGVYFIRLRTEASDLTQRVLRLQ